MTVQAIRRGARPEELERAKALVERLAEPGRAGWEAGEGTIGRLRELGFDWEAAKALVVVIVLAGTETVSSAAPRIVALLLDHGRWDALRGGDPPAVDSARSSSAVARRMRRSTRAHSGPGSGSSSRCTA